MHPRKAWGDSPTGAASPAMGSVGGMARPGPPAHSKSGPLPRGSSAPATSTSPVDYSRTMTGPAYRERGFDASAPIAARVIPEYDASKDRNCPYTQTPKFKSHMFTIERAAAAEKKRATDEKRRAEARERGAALVAGGGVGRNAPGRSLSPEENVKQRAAAGTGRPGRAGEPLSPQRRVQRSC